jgi:hypothetical protein
MTGFDPYDPVDPMGQFNNDPLYPDSGPIPGDPMFQDQLRQASDQVLRRAKEQSIDPMIRSDVQQELWNRQAMRTEPPKPREVTQTVEKKSLSEEEKAALTLHILSTTIVPLEMADDYKHKCKHCSDEVRPYSEGPQHETSCKRHAPILRYDTDLANEKKCKHCDARPSIAGFHHTEDCPRGFPGLPMWNVERGDYGSKCKHCSSEVRPISEGPHHEEDCPRHAPMPLFHTDLAHEYYCTHCDARPFVAGPHHHQSCQRHIKEIAIPVGLLKD